MPYNKKKKLSLGYAHVVFHDPQEYQKVINEVRSVEINKKIIRISASDDHGKSAPRLFGKPETLEHFADIESQSEPSFASCKEIAPRLDSSLNAETLFAEPSKTRPTSRLSQYNYSKSMLSRSPLDLDQRLPSKGLEFSLHYYKPTTSSYFALGRTYSSRVEKNTKNLIYRLCLV